MCPYGSERGAWLPIDAPRVAEGGDRLNSTQLAHKMVDLVEEKQAEDIVLLDLRQVSPFADYFLICSATTERQTTAIVDALTEEIKKEGTRPLHVEGNAGSGWVLIDYGDVIVHVFSPAQRAYYQLEDLWQHAAMVVKIQ